MYRRVYRVEDAQRQGTGVRLPHRSPFCFISRGGINCIAVDFTSPALALACLARRPSKSAVATQSGPESGRGEEERSSLSFIERTLLDVRRLPLAAETRELWENYGSLKIENSPRFGKERTCAAGIFLLEVEDFTRVQKLSLNSRRLKSYKSTDH